APRAGRHLRGAALRVRDGGGGLRVLPLTLPGDAAPRARLLPLQRADGQRRRPGDHPRHPRGPGPRREARAPAAERDRLQRPPAEVPPPGPAPALWVSELGSFRYRSKHERRIARKVCEAVADWGMLDDGDRVMVCISGGKDSYALLDMLLLLARRSPVHYELV